MELTFWPRAFSLGSLIGAAVLVVAACGSPPEPDPATLLWEYPLQQTENPYGSYRVLMDDGVAVISIQGNELHALDAGTGQVLWRKDCLGLWSSRSFDLVDGVVYCANAAAYGDPSFANQIYAVDAMTGEEIWSYSPDLGWAAGRVFVSDDVLIIKPKAFREHMFIALNADTGRLLWEAHMEGLVNYVADRAIYEDAAGEVAAIDVTTGHDLWRRKVPVKASVEVAGSGVVFVQDGGEIAALSGETGREKWKYERPGRSLFLTGVAGEIAIIKSRKQSTGSYPEIHPIDEFCAVDTQTGRDLWCRNVEDAFVQLRDEGVYFSSDNRVALLDARTGGELWSHDREGDAEGIAEVSGRDGELYTHVNGTVSSLDRRTLRARWQYQLDWDSDPSDSRNTPFMAAADNDIVVLWMGAGLAAVGLSPPGGIRAPPTQK